MRIKWLGNPRRLAYTTGEGAEAERHTIHVSPGEEVDIPDGVHLAREGVQWEKAKAAKKDKE